MTLTLWPCDGTQWNKSAEKWNRHRYHPMRKWVGGGGPETWCEIANNPKALFWMWAMCFVCFSHSVLSAININQNYSITLGLFPFQLLHYTFGMAWFSKCVVLGILREFDTFEQYWFRSQSSAKANIHYYQMANAGQILVGALFLFFVVVHCIEGKSGQTNDRLLSGS